MEFGTFHTPMHLNCMKLIFNTNASTSGNCILNMHSLTLRIKRLIYGTQRDHPSLKENILWPGSLKGTDINNCLQLSLSLIFKRQIVHVRTSCFRQSILENHLECFPFPLRITELLIDAQESSHNLVYFSYFFLGGTEGECEGTKLKPAFSWTWKSYCSNHKGVTCGFYTMREHARFSGVVSMLNE